MSRIAKNMRSFIVTNKSSKCLIFSIIPTHDGGFYIFGSTSYSFLASYHQDSKLDFHDWSYTLFNFISASKYANGQISYLYLVFTYSINVFSPCSLLSFLLKKVKFHINFFYIWCILSLKWFKSLFSNTKALDNQELN